VIFTHGHILGFGKFEDFKFEFRSGLNVVFSPNEGGKSTLQHFLLALLYGQLRSDLKMQRRLDPWVERYKPWYEQQYGGMLHCRLASGRELEIRRSFGRDETQIEIRTSTGEDITKQYEQQKNGDVLFARHHFGMPKELYESLGIVKENRASEFHSHDTIRDRLSNLAHSGDEEVSTQRILGKLGSMLDSLGSERAPTKPYRQARNLVHNLQSERKALEEQQLHYREWLQEKYRIADEIRNMDQELFKVRGLLLSARRQDIATRIKSLEDIEGEITDLRKKVDSLGTQEVFPLESLEELDKLVGAGDSIAQRLGEVGAEKEKSLSQLECAASERRELEAYADLATSEESEKITEWFVSHLNLSLQKEKLKKTGIRLRDEADVLKKRLDGLGPCLQNSEIDWDSFAHEAAEDERIASMECSKLSEGLEKEKTFLADAVRTAFNRRVAAVVLIAMASAPFALRHMIRLDGMAEWLQYGFSAGCLLISIWMWWSATRIYRRGRATEQKVRELELKQMEAQEKGGVKRKELDNAIANSGFRSLDAFIKAARKSEQDRMKMAGLIAQLEDVDQQNRRHQSQSDETFRLLKDSLAKVGLSCTPGSLKSQVDLLRGNLRRFHELDVQYHRCIQNVDSLKKEEAALVEESGRKNTRIEFLLEQAGVDTPERFREECSKRRKVKELVEKEASRTREFKRLLEGRTIAQWRESLLEIEEQAISRASVENSGTTDSNEKDESGMMLLPYLPSIAELEEKERHLMSGISDTRQEHAHIIERVRHAFQNYRPSSEIDEDLSLAETKLGDLERNRAALSMAIDTIENLSRHQQEVLAPQLNAAVERRFLQLCSDHYSEVKVDPDFNVLVRETNTGELRSAELLSRGTQDQLYFTIRFGILDLVSNGDESCPCLLDEPFAAYDRPRILEAFKILDEESSRRQLILFTCREDLLDIAGRGDASVITL